MDKAKRIRQLYLLSIVFFILFCALPGVGPLIGGRRPVEFSITGLASQLAGMLAWSLMCLAYQMRGRQHPGASGPVKC